jgi:hypothetical protein
MSKQVIQHWIFDPIARTITLPDFDDAIELNRLALITNLADNQVIFNFADPAKTATVAGNVITLAYNTSTMSATDPLRIDYDTQFGDKTYDKVTVGNARTKFRDGFATSGVLQPNPDTWILNEDTPGKHIINQGGDAAGSSYLRISLDPFTEGDGLSLTSKQTFAMPMRIGWGISASQRIFGQEIFCGAIAVDENGNVPTVDPVADKPITGATASVTSNVATFTLTGHGLKGGDRVNVFNCADHRMNVGPAIVTVVTADTFTLPITITNGSYSTVGGTVRVIDPLRGAKNGLGYLWADSTSVTTAGIVARRNGAKFRNTASTVATITATQSNTSPYTDAFNSAGNQELYMSMDETVARSYASDSNSSTNGYVKFTQGIPDEELNYALHFRVRTLQGYTKPIARVVTAAKSGTTTATITTDVPHGLLAGDYVQIYGTRDQTNFANLATQTVIASVPTSTTFTLVWGTAVTATTVDGTVFVNQGQVAAPGVFGQAIQSISRTNGVLTVNGNTTWATPLPGEYVNIHGLTAAAAGYEGAYKVLRVSTTVLELDAPGADFTSITTGGSVIRRTDVRLHFARVMDYTRLVTEIVGGKGNTSDANGAIPVAITGSATVPASQTTGANTTIWNAAGFGGFMVNDTASAAITSTATTSAVTPASVANVGAYAHSFNVVVTAVSGTTPTMDVGVEESLDNGTNWVRIYDFPRITANGAYTSPLIRAQFGTRYRYVQTIGGTSPSFTRAINRIQFSSNAPLFRQFVDRTINANSVNATTPSPFYNVDGADQFQLTVNMGAITTTAPVFQLQGSEDGTNWYAFGGTLTSVANTTVTLLANGYMPKFCRAFVQTGGVGATLGYVTIKAIGK